VTLAQRCALLTNKRNFLLVCDSKLSKRCAVSLLFLSYLLFLTIVLFLLPYTYEALLAEMCRIGDLKGVGHFKAKF